MNEQQPQPLHDADIEVDFSEDHLLRREAGEGWKYDEPDKRLLGLLIDREVIVESMTRDGLHPPAKHDRIPDKPAPIYSAYLELVKKIDEHKEELDITTPPPLPLEQED